MPWTSDNVKSWSQKEGIRARTAMYWTQARLQELELDPSLGFCFCKCASRDLLCLQSWNRNQFTWAKELVSVSLTRMKVCPWAWGEGSRARNSAFCFCCNDYMNIDVTRHISSLHLSKLIWPGLSRQERREKGNSRWKRIPIKKTQICTHSCMKENYLGLTKLVREFSP